MADKLVPGQFDGMVLIEPIIFPADVAASGEDGLAAGAAKRRPNWTSREEAYQSYKKRAFASWADETLRLYVVRPPSRYAERRH